MKRAIATCVLGFALLAALFSLAIALTMALSPPARSDDSCVGVSGAVDSFQASAEEHGATHQVEIDRTLGGDEAGAYFGNLLILSKSYAATPMFNVLMILKIEDFPLRMIVFFNGPCVVSVSVMPAPVMAMLDRIR